MHEKKYFQKILFWLLTPRNDLSRGGQMPLLSSQCVLLLPKNVLLFIELPFYFPQLPFYFPEVSFCFLELPVFFQKCLFISQYCLPELAFSFPEVVSFYLLGMSFSNNAFFTVFQLIVPSPHPTQSCSRR